MSMLDPNCTHRPDRDMERYHRHQIQGTPFRGQQKRLYRRLSRRCAKRAIAWGMEETGYWLPQYPTSTLLAETLDQLYQRQVEIVHYFWDFGLSKPRMRQERKLLAAYRDLYGGERYSLRTRQPLDRRTRADRRCPADQYYF